MEPMEHIENERTMPSEEDFPSAPAAGAPDDDGRAGSAGEAAEGGQPFVLTPENYYSDRANTVYLSNSLFKSVYGMPGDPWPCEHKALFGPREESEALLIGGYVDAAFDGDDAKEEFVERNREKLMLKNKKGFYKFVTDADIAIARAQQDPVFMSYLDGEHQRVMTGTIAGHLFKVKMDDYKPHQRITDLKYVKSAGEEYNEYLKRRATFVENYGYAIQGAIYQEVERQNSGERLPFYIAYITKEDNPDFGVVQISQDMLDDALDFVKQALAARPMREVRLDPHKCGRRSCAWCRSQQVLSRAYTFQEFADRART